MSTRTQLHPTAKTAGVILGGGLAAIFVVFGIRQYFGSHPSADNHFLATQEVIVVAPAPTMSASIEPLLPILELTISDASLESGWSAALAAVLGGQTEVSVEGGRIDILTDNYAIEVDRLEKWHEAIGQAAHYGLKSDRIAVAALMVPSDLWPMNAKTKAKLLLIDETCTKQSIKLVILRRSADSKDTNR
ncbi:MAG: hypothetical protein WD872_01830 [Pirellulaceae bacterium]